MKKVVAIGGGTGTSGVVSALKKVSNIEPAAIVGMADSGGSTGCLRDEFGFPPVGDVRQSLAALAETNSQDWIRKILLYRFSKGEGLKGHNLGNLFLLALQDMTGSTGEALAVAQQVLRLEGKVYPATIENVQLEVAYEDGKVVVGESCLDDPSSGNRPIKDVQLLPHASIYPEAERALLGADLVIIGPGDYFASILATLKVLGMRAALQRTSAPILFIQNLMSRYTQTDGWTAKKYVEKISAEIGRPPDWILLNTASIDPKILANYALAQEYPIQDDLGENKRVIREDVVEDVQYQQSSSDPVPRSVLRHSPAKLARVLQRILLLCL